MILSVIIPVYHCEDCLILLYERIVQTVNVLSGITDYEIIFVEDCGQDGSWEVIETLAKRDVHVHGIQFSRNFGQHHSITAGIELCKGDWAVVMDCDLQDRPEDIANLWQKVQEGYDIVNARRQKRQDSWWRKMTSRLYHIIFEWLCGLSYDPQVANFRIISRKVISAYNSMQESSRAFGAQIQWLGFPTGYIDVQHETRHEGESAYTFKKLLYLAVEVITSYSNKPLKLSIGLGFTISFFSAIGLIWIMIRTFGGMPVEGWASLMVSIWFLGGIIIANLGIIGLYLGKIYDETRKRPIYVISKRVN
jgi:glycosyltransferase involved in cell wall biosynthesis